MPRAKPQRTAAPEAAPITVSIRQQTVRSLAPSSSSTRAPLSGSRKPVSEIRFPSIFFSQRAKAPE